MTHLTITLNLLLKVCFGITLFTWVVFTYSPTSSFARVAVGSGVLPLLFALGLPLVAWKLELSSLNISKLESIRAILFSRDDIMLVFILQYVAFGLIIGCWMSLDGARLGIPTYIMVPCLAFTMYTGPLGVLMYAIARYTLRGKVLLFDTLYDDAERAETIGKERDA